MLQDIIEKIKAGSQRDHNILLLMIIATGFALRFYSLYAGEGYREFAVGDELHAYGVALGLLTGADRPVVEDLRQVDLLHGDQMDFPSLQSETTYQQPPDYACTL